MHIHGFGKKNAGDLALSTVGKVYIGARIVIGTPIMDEFREPHMNPEPETPAVGCGLALLFWGLAAETF